MTKQEMVEQIDKLLTENPERKTGAANAAKADIFNCYSWDDHSGLIKAHCYTQIKFYNLLAEGDAEKIASWIEQQAEAFKRSFIYHIEYADDWVM